MTRSDASTSGISTPQPDERSLARNWVLYGMSALIIGDLAYFVAAAPLGLPHQVVLLFGFAFGPLLSLAFVGLYYFFRSINEFQPVRFETSVPPNTSLEQTWPALPYSCPSAPSVWRSDKVVRTNSFGPRHV